ncbi:hypothetical protein UD636_09540 [Citrobacter braakii]|uniref:hypothetical protein n=1 Tax=Citrobacter braakii TaxID=57706 RepID=UPI0039844A6A
MNGTSKLIITLVFGILVWGFSPFIYTLFLKLYPVTDYSGRGVFGDSFGSVTSLFSFLSFAAVIFAFYRTQDIDNEKTRPFIITNVDKNSVPGKFSVKNSAENITIEIKLKLKNHSEHLAHSVKIQSQIEAKDEKYDCASTLIHYPITDSEVDAPNILLNTGKSKCLNLLNSLTTSESVRLSIKITYKNAANKEFTTTNNYLLSIPQSDFPAINDLRQGSYNDGHWGGGKFIAINIVESEDFII